MAFKGFLEIDFWLLSALGSLSATVLLQCSPSGDLLHTHTHTYIYIYIRTYYI